MRGIPQGSDIQRFFGNLFLAPVDEALIKEKESLDIIYYRYMDDIRIFSKTEKAARTALLKFEAELRKRHLNLQSAKTKVLRNKEVSNFLIDNRLTRFKNLEDNLKKGKIEKSDYLKELSKLQKTTPDAPDLGEQKIYGARKPLTGLSDRLFRRLLKTHIELKDETILPRLISEISRNNDHRYNRYVIQASKTFPRKKMILSKLYAMISSDQPPAPSREADFINACRYQSRVSPKMLYHCKSRAADISQDPQVRIQSLILRARTKLDTSTINLVKGIFDKEENISIKRAAALILVRQRGKNNEVFIEELVFHPNNELRKFGRYLHSCKTNKKTATAVIEQAFNSEFPWLLVDYIPLL